MTYCGYSKCAVKTAKVRKAVPSRVFSEISMSFRFLSLPVALLFGMQSLIHFEYNYFD